MHTGYDNIWYYQNNRPEPLTNLQGNDSIIYSLLTNQYKQQLREVPNSQNDQIRTVPTYKWPASVHSQSFNSPNENYYSQAFPAQTGNFRYYSQPSKAQQNCDIPNSGANIFQNNNGYDRVNCATRISQNNNYYDPNNGKTGVNNISGFNSNCVLNQKITHYEDPLNYSINNCNRICDFNSNLSASSHFQKSYVPPEQQSLNYNQNNFQYSSSSYQNNSHISSKSQFLINDSRQMGNNSQSENFLSYSNAFLSFNRRVLKDFLHKKSNSSIGNNRINVTENRANLLSCPKTINSNISHETNNKVYDFVTVEMSEKLLNLNSNHLPVVQKQGNFQSKEIINQTSSLTQNSFMQDSMKKQKRKKIVCPKAKNLPYKDFGNDLIKITVPYTGQTTFINPNEYSNRNNSSLNLRDLLDSSTKVPRDGLNKNVQNHTNDNSIVPHMGQDSGMNGNKSISANPIPNTQNHSSYSTQNNCCTTCTNFDSTFSNCMRKSFGNSVVSAQRFQENQEVFSSSNTSLTNNLKDLTENTAKVGENNFGLNETVLDFNKNTTLNEVSVKRENIENDTDIQVDENFTFDQEIKTEEYSTNFSVDEPEQKENSEDLKISEETLPSDSENIKRDPESVAASQETETQSKILTQQENAESIPVENTIFENSKNNEDKEVELEYEKLSITDRNYESQINRDKLDLLIKFLNKEEESDPVLPDFRKNNEETSTRNRRKLSKTRIVKNKNNSREMISLKTPKTTRTGNSQESPKPVKTAETTEEKSNSNCLNDVTIHEKSISVSEDHVSEKEEKSDLKETKVKSVSVRVQTEEISTEEEKNLINFMQALQSLKTHYCVNCSLVSSVDSFWVNVVSGKLKCLNCFKKVSLKTNENVSKRTEYKFSEAKLLKEGENQENKKSEMVCHKSKYENVVEKSPHSKINLKQSIAQSTKDNITPAFNRDQSPVFECKIKNTHTSEVTRKKSTEEQKKVKVRLSQEKSDKIIPSKELFSKTQNSDEKVSQVKSRTKSSSEEHSHNSNINTVHHSEHFSNSAGKKSEEIGNSKVKVQSVEDFRKGKQSPNESVEKYSFTEQQVSPKSKISKENMDREEKGNTEKSVKHILSKYDVLDSCKKNHSRESSHGRKRSSSKEEFSSHKIRILEEHMGTSVVKSSKESSVFYKSYTPEEAVKKSKNISLDKSNLSEETNHKAKISKFTETKKSNTFEECLKKNKSFHKDLEKNKCKEFLDHSRKRKKSIEEFIPFKVRPVNEHLKEMKFTKHSSDNSKSTSLSHRDNSGFINKTEHYRNEDTAVPKIKNKCNYGDEQSKNFNTSIDKMRKSEISKENPKSPTRQVPEQLKKGLMSHENIISETSDKEKKQFLGKIPKISQKNIEKDFSKSFKLNLHDEKNPK